LYDHHLILASFVHVLRIVHWLFCWPCSSCNAYTTRSSSEGSKRYKS